MTTPTAAQVEWAERLLARLAADGSERGSARAMDRACARLEVGLGPVIGQTGVRAILARSVRLAAAQDAVLSAVLRVEGFARDPASALRDGLDGQAGAEAGRTLVLATFLALLDGFIGASLTRQVIETAWSASEETEQ